MTISLTYREFLELFHEADKKQLHLDISDDLDVTWEHDGRLGREWSRWVQLRKGISLCIQKGRSSEP